MPPDWDGFEVVRRIRSAQYRIKFRNPGGLSTGRVELTIDGQSIEGNVAPYFEAGVHEVDAVLRPAS